MTDNLNATLESLSKAQLQWLYRLTLRLGAAAAPEELVQQALAEVIAIGNAGGGRLAWPGLSPIAIGATTSAAAGLHISLPNPGGEAGELQLFAVADGDPAIGALLTAAAAQIGVAIARVKHVADLHAIEQAREQMINLLVHDIRSPLVATHASIEVTQRLLSGTPTNPTIFETLATGLRSVRSAVELCNDMLEVKRLQSGYRIDRRNFGVAELLGDVAQMLQNVAAQRDCSLTATVRPLGLEGSGDVRLLRRVITNLVANAIRFSPTQEHIVLEGRADAVGGILLLVSDRGPGVKPDDRERIFEPFMQGSGEMHRGTGLGLHFCRHAVLAHGGRIWVEDRDGGGCRFMVWLPNA